MGWHAIYGGSDAVDRTEMQTLIDDQCPSSEQCPTVDGIFTEFDINLSEGAFLLGVPMLCNPHWVVAVMCRLREEVP